LVRIWVVKLALSHAMRPSLKNLPFLGGKTIDCFIKTEQIS
jgi:hypothetical protein